MAGELVLIVEDNEKNLKLARDVLQFNGYQTIEAGTGEDGVRLCRAQMPALVLMDIQLPGIDGFEAFRRIRADAKTAKIPVVAVTASVMAADEIKITEAGFDGYLRKPVSIQGLVDAVAEQIQGPQTEKVPSEDSSPAVTEELAVSATTTSGRILVVDDTPRNVKLLADILTANGHQVLTAAGGAEALDIVSSEPLDLVLLDVVMPGMTGYEVCTQIRANKKTQLLPVVMVTALDPGEERIKGIEAGADDFLTKPINQAELLARVRSLLRVKSLHNRVAEQTEQLEDWNQTLEQRVQEQMRQLERASTLERFLPASLASQVIDGDPEAILETHRREITAVSVGLLGFSTFSESAEPEEVMGVLRDYHAEMGKIIGRHQGSLGTVSPESMMVFLNDPVKVPDPEIKAIHMALEMRERMVELADQWRKHRWELSCGLGLDTGYATLGVIGFDQRWDYAAIGTVTNLAARLGAEAGPGQILISKRFHTRIEELVDIEELGDLTLRGFPRSVEAFSVLGLKGTGAKLVESSSLIGRTLGHHRILGKLGEGGMGQVYLAEDTTLGRKVALKLISFAAMRRDPNPEREQRLLRRFQREARAIAALNHPGIVTIHSVDEQFGMRFLTMEFVDGSTLGDAIPEGGFDTSTLVDLGAQLAGALSAAHERGIVHRDLKPANVMVTRDRRIKVLDFGLAKLREAPSNDDQEPVGGDLNTMSIDGPTVAGRVIGTPGYMSPEQLTGAETDSRSDIFSAGILLYMMATGKHPFVERENPAAVMAVLQEELAPVTELAPHHPSMLEGLIARCLDKEPSARYASGQELLSDFDELRVTTQATSP